MANHLTEQGQGLGAAPVNTSASVAASGFSDSIDYPNTVGVQAERYAAATGQTYSQTPSQIYSNHVPTGNLQHNAKLTGLKDGQNLHHFLRDAMWQIEQARAIRLHLIRQQIGTRPISLCIDKTGDAKKGSTTDYVSKQYIGNLGKTANGIVSVNAYAVVDGITYPLLSKIYKPRTMIACFSSA